MSLLEIVQDACAALAVPIPPAVVSSPQPVTQRMLRLVMEELESLRSIHNWQALITQVTLSSPTVSGGVSTYTLPSDFQRFVRSGDLYDVGRSYALGGPSSVADWQRDARFTSLASRRWRRYGNSLRLLGGVATDQVSFEYISSHTVKDSAGVAKARFTADTDSPRMPENLVRLGLKWRFQRAAGLDYAESMSDYGRELERAANEDSGGARMIRLGPPVFDAPGMLDGRGMSDGIVFDDGTSLTVE